MADEASEQSSTIVETKAYESNFILNEGETPSGSTLNVILKRLAANDQSIAGSFKEVPGVWFCRWYDNELEKGYDRGDFFWVNTENTESFIRDNNKKIMDLANKNPFVENKLPPWKNNDSEIFDMYYNALTGYVDDKISKSLPPIYYLGEISNDFQIIVSQKNKNKDIPGTVEALSSWKNFAVNTDLDFDHMMLVINENVISAMNRHLDKYHLGKNIHPTQKNIDHLSTAYADEDFTNVSFSYPKNYVANDFQTTGMDCVESYVRRPYPNQMIGKYMVEETWFRKWKSGYLEHGGIIDLRRHRNENGIIEVTFQWKLLSDGDKYLQRDYLGISSGDAIHVDESYQRPPGDDLIEVLRELDSLFVGGSDYSPIFYKDNYVVSLTPIQPQFAEENEIGNVPSYDGMGYNLESENFLNVSIDRENSSMASMCLKWNPNSTTPFYSYYVTGFCLP